MSVTGGDFSYFRSAGGRNMKINPMEAIQGRIDFTEYFILKRKAFLENKNFSQLLREAIHHYVISVQIGETLHGWDEETKAHGDMND